MGGTAWVESSSTAAVCETEPNVYQVKISGYVFEGPTVATLSIVKAPKLSPNPTARVRTLARKALERYLLKQLTQESM
jgi:hypothetical protein